tara:strand:- start:7055 stop:7600 length:546 start_codon:yes stop_codon:yes gene_type:complete
MMKKITFLTLFLCTIVGYGQGIYKVVGGDISFFSETPMENIDAVNDKVKGLIKPATGDLAFMATNVGFHFEKPLMEEHFNENYMESDKYKVSSFKGKIIEKIDYSVDGNYKVTVKGTLNIHGVEKNRVIAGEVIILDGNISVKTVFDIQVKDHKIDIPKLVVKNIAETIKVTVNLNFELKK